MQHFVKIYIIAVICMALLLSCEQKRTNQDSKIVLEGWMAENEPPIVFLHQTYTFNESYDSIEKLMEDKIIMFGNVSVDDGENKVSLIGQADISYLLTYKYSTSRMVGELGKEYTVTAEYNGKTVSAKTTLLPKTPIDSIKIKSLANDRCDIRVCFTDDSRFDKNYYLLMYKYLGKTQYTSCPLGICDNSRSKNGYMEIQAYRRTASLITDTVPTIQFSPNDSVFFKLCHIDYTSYKIWNNLVSKTISPNIPIANVDNLETNVVNGEGYWCGLNGTECFITIKPDTTYLFN